MTQQTNYVLGFMLSENGHHVLLQQRRKPPFAGLLNAPGGKMEDKETPLEAMRREWTEETGMLHQNWQLFGRFEMPYAQVFCFACMCTKREIQKAVQQSNRLYMRDMLVLYNVPQMLGLRGTFADNLLWLVPAAWWALHHTQDMESETYTLGNLD